LTGVRITVRTDSEGWDGPKVGERSGTPLFTFEDSGATSSTFPSNLAAASVCTREPRARRLRHTSHHARLRRVPWLPGKALATYNFFTDAPIQFERSLHAQVNWGYDVGHNVPRDLCPPLNGTGEGGCPVEYAIMSYLYLAAPADASPSVKRFPWASWFD
jgi:hypothetical protein